MGRRACAWLAGALAVGTAMLVPGGPPAGAVARTVGREVTATPAGELASQTVAVAASAPSGRRSAAPAEVPVDPGTQMVGVSWAGTEPVEVQVALPEGGGWGPWVDLHGEDAPDVSAATGADGRTGVGPLWLGGEGVDRVAVRVVDGAPADLRVEAMRFDERATPRAVTYDRPATPAGGPAVATRSSWAPGGWQGGRAGCTPAPEVMSALRFAVVHHTDGTNTYSAAQVPGILAGIYRFHTATRGWCDIAYNLFVDRFGTVWEGRSGGLDAPVQGGHAKGFNTHSVGVALIGQHQPGVSPAAAAPTTAAMGALRDVLAWKLGAHGIDPRATTQIVSNGSPKYTEGTTVVLPTVQGHRDSGLTACPGDLVVARMPALRQDVAARIAATRDPQAWQPAATGAAFYGRIEDAAAGGRVPNGRAGYYTSLVARGGWPRDVLATGIVLGGPTDSRIGSVDRLYRAAFGRQAATDELLYWIGRRDRGLAVGSMARLFRGSPEFRAAYDALADPAFVTAIYRNVLGRDPDAAGRAYWVDRLARGLTRHQLLASFSEGGEHRTRTRVATTITRAFVVLLGRAPTAQERQAWTRVLEGGGGDTGLVALLIASQEYAASA